MIGGSSLSDCARLRQGIKKEIFLISLSCGFCSCTDWIIKASLVCTLLVISQKAQPRGSCMKMVPYLLLLKGQRRSGRKPLSLWQSMALQLSSLCHQPRPLGPPNCRVHHLTSHPWRSRRVVVSQKDQKDVTSWQYSVENSQILFYVHEELFVVENNWLTRDECRLNSFPPTN